MPTTEKKEFKKKKVFQVARELNISTDRVEEFLQEEGYADALSGSGFNAKIVDEEAYLVLREEYDDDAQAAERIRELRASDAKDAKADEAEDASQEPQQEDVEPTPEAEEDAQEEDAQEEGEAVSSQEQPDATVSVAETADDDAVAETSPKDEQPESSEQAAPVDDADPVSDESASEAAEDDAVAEGAATDAQVDTVEQTDDPSPETEDVISEEEEEPSTTSADADVDAEQVVADQEAVEDDASADKEETSSETASETAEIDAQAGASEETSKGVSEEDSDEVSTDDAEDATAEDDSVETPSDPAEDDAVAEEEEPTATASDEPVAESTDTSTDDVEDVKAEGTDADESGTSEAKADATDADADTSKASGEADGQEAGDQEDADDAEKAEDGTLKANRYRLTGTQVVGKVDLGKMRRRKRKRKRKKKEKKEQKKREKQKKKEQQKKQKQRKQRKKKKKRRRRGKPKEEDVEKTIQETLQELEQGASRARQRRRRRRRKRHEEERKRERERKAEEESVLRVTEYVSTGELANLMGEPVKEVIASLFDAGMMVSINQRLDRDTIEFIAAEYGMEVEFIDEFSTDALEVPDDDPEDMEPRAPVVTVMGHVDHGKTSLLDYIRSANVVAGEEGGITQHIGAHQVNISDQEGTITFLDTPGHEAFTAMRARGAKATDIVILVVAADDAVMPQTIEAINHSQAANVPIVVAINKMDKPEADAQRVKAELAEHNVLVEEYGGDVQSSEVSAETGQGIDDLLEKVLLQSELLELKANPDREADGVIIESRLEKGRGNVITVLVQNGTLEVGDPFVAGMYSGRVRAMFDERDNRIEEVGPSQPALVLGCNGSPEVGDQFVVLEDESEARDIAQNRQRIHREQELRRKSQLSLDEIGRRLSTGEFSELNLIVKADVGGSVEALADALLKLKTDEVAVRIIHSGVGAINESDVMLARASEAVIIGFQVRPTSGARDTAKREDVDIRTYSIIYDAIEDVHDALEGMLSPEKREDVKGRAEVREIFKVPGVGTVAGTYVTDGTISRDHRVRVLREGVVVYEGEIGSLKRFQDDVKEVKKGFECGMSIENFDDVKVGDEFETYVIVEERRTLEV